MNKAAAGELVERRGAGVRGRIGRSSYDLTNADLFVVVVSVAGGTERSGDLERVQLVAAVVADLLLLLLMLMRIGAEQWFAVVASQIVDAHFH